MRHFLGFYRDWFSCWKMVDCLGWAILYFFVSAFFLFASPLVLFGSIVYSIGSIPIHKGDLE